MFYNIPSHVNIIPNEIQVNKPYTDKYNIASSSLKAPSVKYTNPYANFLYNVKKHNVEKVKISQDQSWLKYNTLDGKNENIDLPKNYDYIGYLIDNDIDFEIQKKDEFTIIDLFTCIIELMIIRVLYMFILNKNGGKKFEGGYSNITFDDVGGVTNAKRDLMEVIEFIKNNDKYTTIGARIPKGILLTGNPGCGKTMLVKALAGEANVPVIVTSGSDFVEMYVGVGASRIRSLFEQAKKQKPCIIFIDEIDAIGKQRNSDSTGGNMEYDQTLNQLLTCMDGFEESDGILVIAATNRPDMLDNALVRAGRFDRKIEVELPSYDDRLSILNIVNRGRELSKDISLEKIAKITNGFSGADLENLSNEAAIYAIRDNNNIIEEVHWDMAYDKIILGDPRNVTLNSMNRKILAYHEAGHALASVLVNDFDELKRISIVPRGRTGGATYFEHNHEIELYSQRYLKNKIMVALAGRIAEEIILGTHGVTTGATGDMSEVLRIAYDIVATYGFSQKLGPISWSAGNSVPVEVNDEIYLIVNNCYRRVKIMMKRYEKYLHRIAKDLLKKGTLNQNEFLESVKGISCKIYIKKRRLIRVIKKNNKQLKDV